MRLTAVLLSAALLPLLAAAPALATTEPAPEDPCAPVDGVPPLMCQSGTPVESPGQERPVQDGPVPDGPGQGLPLTGAPSGAAAAALAAAGAALVVRRRAAA